MTVFRAMGVDLTVWRMRIAGFPNRGPSRRRKRREDSLAKCWGRSMVLGVQDSPLSREGKLCRKKIFQGSIISALLSLFVFYLLFKVENGDQNTGLQHFSSSTTAQPLAGRDTNNDIFFNVPHLLLLGGDIEENPGPDKKISWDNTDVIARSSGTPTCSEWVFTQKPENQALQGGEEEAKKAAKEELEREKTEEKERRANRKEEENAAWLQGLNDEAHREALEAEEKKRADEEARVQAEEDEERRKKSEDETLWTPTESTNESTPTPPQRVPLLPLQVEKPQPSSHTSSVPENPMSPEVSKYRNCINTVRY